MATGPTSSNVYSGTVKRATVRDDASMTAFLNNRRRDTTTGTDYVNKGAWVYKQGGSQPGMYITDLSNPPVAYGPLGPIVAGGVPVTELWVDGSTTQTSGNSGALATPFQKLSDALAFIAANASRFTTTGVVLRLMPGTYTEAVLVPDIGLPYFGIVGSDRNSCRIVASNATAIVKAAPTVAGSLAGLRVSDVTITQNGAGLCLQVDGTGLGAGSTVGSNGVDLINTDMVKGGGGNTVQLTCCNIVNIRDGDTWQGTTVIQEVAAFFCWGMISMAASLRWDEAQTKPANARNPAYFGGRTSLTALTILAQGGVFVDATCLVVALTATALSTSGTRAPNIQVFGLVLGAAAITLPANTASATSNVDFTGSRWQVGSTLTIAGAAGTARNAIAAREASFEMTAGGSISSGAECDLDLRGSFFNNAALAVAGNGTIDRDSLTIAAGNIAQAGTAETFTVPFPAGATYTVEAAITALTAAGTITYSALATTGFTATAVGNGGAAINAALRVARTR